MPIVALEYHDIVQHDRWDESGFSGPGAATYKLDVSSFAEHADAVRRTGVDVATDATQIAPDSKLRLVLWTFDDGGEGYFANAAGVLEQHGWRGHVLMATAQIDRPGFLTKAQLRDLHERGHVIGTHSRNHLPRLSGLPDHTIVEEWRASVADLQDVLGSRVTVGSVPAGEYSRRVAELAAAQGITRLFTSEPETDISTVNGCLVIGRFTLRRGDPASYAAGLVGHSSTARRLQWLKWNAKKVAKSLGGAQYYRIRERLLGP